MMSEWVEDSLKFSFIITQALKGVSSRFIVDYLFINFVEVSTFLQWLKKTLFKFMPWYFNSLFVFTGKFTFQVPKQSSSFKNHN